MRGIALVSGVIGAMGYWHFFGSKSSDKAGSQQSGGKAQAGSGSQKSSSGKTSRRENGTPGFSPFKPNTYGGFVRRGLVEILIKPVAQQSRFAFDAQPAVATALLDHQLGVDASAPSFS